MVDQRAIYSLKFTSEASHSRVSAYSTRLTSQDIPQMESLFAGQTGRTNFSAHTYLATCIPTRSNFVVYRLECNFKSLLGNWREMLSVILPQHCVESNFLWLIQVCKGSWVNLTPQRIPVMQFDPKNHPV